MADDFRRFARPHEDGETHIDATEARQARWGRHAFVMLVCSTALAVIALFSAWAFKSDDLASADDKSSPTAAEARAGGEPVG